MTSKATAITMLKEGGILSNFMSAVQRRALTYLLGGEESSYFIEQVTRTVKAVTNTPLTYQTESIETADKVLHLHYFKGGIDAWIVERDMGDSPSDNGLGEQHQAYGKITLCGGGWEEAEWGYISIKDLIDHGVELDLHWEPKTVKEMK